jgi:phosphohistidine phosphatase
MKTLYLFRHAKSSWESAGVADSDRPLIPKGVQKTELIIGFLRKRDTIFDLIISSPAVRAYETAKLVATGLNYPVENIQLDRKIYDGYYDRILDIIYGTSNEVNSVAIFGHNPTITHLANLFLHPGIENMPTSSVVCLSFPTDKWEEIPANDPLKEFFTTPKMLKTKEKPSAD